MYPFSVASFAWLIFFFLSFGKFSPLAQSAGATFVVYLLLAIELL